MKPAVLLIQYLLILILMAGTLLIFVLITQYWNEIRADMQKQPISVAMVISIVCAAISLGVFLLLWQ